MKHVTLELLDLMVQPAFAAEGQIITKVNHAAAQLLIREGQCLDQLLQTGTVEYASFTSGSLYVTLNILGSHWGACVTHTDMGNVFLLDQSSDDPALQLLALAARELRSPLSDAMISAQHAADTDDPALLETTAHLNRKLYQLLRLVSNMSDAANASAPSNQQEVHMDALFREIFEKAAYFAEEAGFTLEYEGLSEEVFSLADSQQLERAALNLVSNAMKFSPKGTAIHCRFAKRGSILQLQVLNQGDHVPENLLSTIFQRHLRQPAIEDSRCGIGLGMLLVRSAASNHGGAVLVDQPEPNHIRITMTLAIRPGKQTVSCPLQADYVGERDHALVELSDSLPASAYYFV